MNLPNPSAPAGDRLESIKNFYRNILSREPDKSGLDYWYTSDFSLDQIENLIKESDEAKYQTGIQDPNVSNSRVRSELDAVPAPTPVGQRLESIKNYYRDILCREPDRSGLEFWSCSSFTLDQIENFIRKSDEAQSRVGVLKSLISKYHCMISAHTITPIADVVQQAFHIPAHQWQGAFNIRMPGKAGEILFLLGLLPALRSWIPRAKIVIHTLPHYIDLISNVAGGPDRIVALEYGCSTIAESVGDAIFSKPIVGFEIKENDLWVCPYRTNPCNILDTALSHGPFYRGFADAIGVIPFSFSKPIWLPLKDQSSTNRPIALALPNTNAQASIRRTLPFSAQQWAELANILRGRGLTPLATGHHEDPSPGLMPGWEWLDCSLVEAATLALQAQFVLSSNSGLGFSAAAFGRAQTIIFDENNHVNMTPRCGLEILSDVFDIGRLWWIFLPIDGSMDQRAFDLAAYVADRPSLRGGFAVGY